MPNAKPTLETILAEMEAMLPAARAEVLRRSRSAEDPAALRAALTDLRIWGGDGSIVDQEFADPARDRRYNELIVDLAEAIEDLGWSNARVRWVARTIEDHLARTG